MTTKPALPKWLKLANRLIIAINRLGMSLGTWYILSIPGRKTGKMRSTPVSVLHVNGQRYVVTGFETQWVKNARKAGKGMLARGRKKEQVVLVELVIEDRSPILREFPAGSKARQQGRPAVQLSRAALSRRQADQRLPERTESHRSF